jgi:4-hydroxybutyrate CoA-transferase
MGPCGGVGCLAALEIAEKVILSVNESLPYVRGERNRIHVDQATHITRTDTALAAPPAAAPTETEKEIAARILPYVQDGDTLQIGIGGIPNALAYGLDSKKDLGIHTEMLTDSIVHLAKQGVVTGRCKNFHPGKIVFSFASGSQELLDFTNENDDLLILPVEEVVSTSEAARNDNFCAINTCIMVDLTGQVASESVGLTQISGTGGQLDLIRGAKLSKGGRAFVALTSTRDSKDGLVSNIRLTLPPGTAVTTPRSDAQYIVTEYGVADMRQRSLEERARSLIEIAHPDFRKGLMGEAQSVGVIRS